MSYKIYSLDNYNMPDKDPGNFIKQLAKEYDFWDYGYRVYLSAENPNATAQQIGIYAQLIALLSKIRDILMERARNLGLWIQR